MGRLNGHYMLPYLSPLQTPQIPLSRTSTRHVTHRLVPTTAYKHDDFLSSELAMKSVVAAA